MLGAYDAARPGGASDEHGEHVPLRLDHRQLDVAEILSVDLQRQRPVAADDEVVEVVAEENVFRSQPAAAAWKTRRGTARARTPSGDDVEPTFEGGVGREAEAEEPA
jgi:hypothetical protein